MTRLYDDLLQRRPALTNVWGWESKASLFQASEAHGNVLAKLRDATVIVADNVAEYYYAESSQEVWTPKDFPIVAPPMETMWIESRRASRILSGGEVLPGSRLPRRWGALIQSQDADLDVDLTEDAITAATREIAALREKEGDKTVDEIVALAKSVGPLDAMPSASHDALTALFVADALARGGGSRVQSIRWVCQATIWLDYDGPQWTRAILTYHVYADGSLSDDCNLIAVGRGGEITEDKQDYASDLRGFLRPFWLAISFMHCKNVELVERPGKYVSRQARRAAERRGDPPPTKFYTLTIDPMRKVLRTEGQSEKVGLKKALHICRGHFAHYSQDRPLFGKYAGRFWVPAHVRGSSEAGIVGKDYRVLPGTAS